MAVIIIYKNKIEYSNRVSLGHEMLHMASAARFDNCLLSGFSQYAKGLSIGNGVDEGYTELLTSRLFNNGKVRTYKNEVWVMSLIEKFFDDPKDLSHLYFNCNLPGLIYYLEKYSSRKDVINLILDIDMFKGSPLSLINPLGLLKKVKTGLSLYEMYKKKTSDPVKIKEFEDVLFQDKLVKLFVNHEKIKLARKQLTASSLSFENGYNNKKK